MHHLGYDLSMITQQCPHPPAAQHLHRPAAPASQQRKTAMPDREDLSAGAIWAAIRRRFGTRTLVSLGLSVLLSAVAPLIFYARIQHLVGSQVTALLIAGAIPLAWTAGNLAVRRRLDPVGALSVAGFGIGLLMLEVTGSAFAFKIHDGVLAGAIGVVCLASMAVGRPLFGLLLPKSVSWPGMTRRTVANWVTGIWGVVLVADAAVIMLLAATLPTRTFLAVQHPVGLTFIAAGIAGVIWRRRHRPAAQPSGCQEARS
jgi:hypothetical protein